jgi:CheY-like chemotaxis protein
VRLLVIDDSEDDLLLACAAFERAGVAVAVQRVEEQEELRAALEESEWDLCLLDWVLPKLTTPEAIRLLRSSRQPDLPVLVWSGRHDAKVAWVSREVLGAAGFLVKGEMDPLLPQMAQAAARRS